MESWDGPWRGDVTGDRVCLITFSPTPSTYGGEGRGVMGGGRKQECNLCAIKLACGKNEEKKSL